MCRIASLLSKGVEISSGFVCNQDSRIIEIGYEVLRPLDTESIIFVRSWFLLHPAYDARMCEYRSPEESVPSSVDSMFKAV
jgi:hypothetical protein